MTTPIRPGLTPLATPAPQKSAQALAAQRAFFQQALTQAGPPAASAPVAQTAPAAATSTSAPAASSEPATRPGRYLDIRV